ncbi:hypothetical protein PVK06_014885 [Gossypium arboreum]|uniref:Uncharacterized protein n=1 Tax=Gossypium arboreum TaxID=29729 RepID=A0ABR0PVP0_GOSAR|nr:hypothetical protein PVK06_014885 [Gossypium arboreum]
MDPYLGGSWTMIPSIPTHSNLVENLADTIDNGSRDQHSDALVNELNNHFEKCQQLLNSIAASINSKSMTVEGQKKKLEESEQLLNQRRESCFKEGILHCVFNMSTLVRIKKTGLQILVLLSLENSLVSQKIVHCHSRAIELDLSRVPMFNSERWEGNPENL